MENLEWIIQRTYEWRGTSSNGNSRYL